jgi:hypothetical protein
MPKPKKKTLTPLEQFSIHVLGPYSKTLFKALGKTEKKILEMIIVQEKWGGVTPAQIFTTLNLDDGNTYRYLKQLKEYKFITETHEGLLIPFRRIK